MPIRDGKPIIGDLWMWLHQKYANRNPDHQISACYAAHSQDGREVVAIVYSKNEDIIKQLIQDFKLQVIKTNAEADALTAGWKRGSNSKFEDLTSKSTTRRDIDDSTFDEITECCMGCKNNPDGQAQPVVKRKAITKPQAPPKLKEVRIEESEGEIAITITNDDDTKLGYVLDNKEKKFTEKAIMTARELLSNWGNKIGTIADSYLKEKRNVDAFLYEIIALGRFISELPLNARFLLKPYEPKSLLHNRVMAQLLYEYSITGCDIIPKQANNKSKSNDFDACGIKCDVKTIRVEGLYERHHSRGVKLTSESASRLKSRIQDSISEKTEQVGNGMIFLAPLSPIINSMMRTYFLNQLRILPPPPEQKTTVFVLNSDMVFYDYYIVLDTSLVMSTVTRMLDEIESFGILLTISGIRNGLRMQLTTASKDGSSIGRVDKLF